MSFITLPTKAMYAVFNIEDVRHPKVVSIFPSNGAASKWARRELDKGTYLIKRTYISILVPRA